MGDILSKEDWMRECHRLLTVIAALRGEIKTLKLQLNLPIFE